MNHSHFIIKLREYRKFEQELKAFAREFTKGIPERITPTQYDVLDCLHHHGPCNQKTISSYTRVDRSTVAEVVRRLLKKGFVTISEDIDDRRVNLVALTKEGRATLTKCYKTEEKLSKKK